VTDLTQTRKKKAKTRKISPKKVTRITKKKSLIKTVKT
jgi:hypothetical protein